MTPLTICKGYKAASWPASPDFPMQRKEEATDREGWEDMALEKEGSVLVNPKNSCALYAGEQEPYHLQGLKKGKASCTPIRKKMANSTPVRPLLLSMPNDDGNDRNDDDNSY